MHFFTINKSNFDMKEKYIFTAEIYFDRSGINVGTTENMFDVIEYTSLMKK